MVLRPLGALALASLLITSCKGLHTQPNDVGEVPQGALVEAVNVVVSRDGIIEPRRGLKRAGTQLPGTNLIGTYSGKTIRAGGGTLESSSDLSAWTTLLESDEVTGWVEKTGNLYVATSDGVQRVEAAATDSAFPAGMPPARDIDAAYFGGTTIPEDSSAAYRTVWTYLDPRGRRIVGAPSGRRAFTAASGARNFAPCTAIPPGLPAGAVAEFYRTSIVASPLTPDDEMKLVGQRSVPAAATATSLERTSSTTVTVTTSADHGFQIGDVVTLGHGSVSGSGSSVFVLGTSVVSAVPSTSSFQYQSTGLNGTAGSLSIDCTPLAVGILDTWPDDLTTDPLYTNQSQNGAISAAYPPPVASRIADFRSCMFFGDTQGQYDLTIQLLGVYDDADGGVRAGDTITIGGTQFSAVASGLTSDGRSKEIPDDQTNTFMVYVSAAGPNANTEDAAHSLIRAINRYGSGEHPLFATYASIVDGAPGLIRISSPTAFTVSASRSSSWSGLGTALSDDWANGLYWSEQEQPDSVPVLNYMRVGDDSAIRAMVPLRDALIILKDDGIYRLTGDTPSSFRVDPLDLTVKPLEGRTAVALNNTVFAWASQGVVRISDTGVTIISRPIEDQLWPLAVLARRDLAFGVSYEADHKYLLWLPRTGDSASASRAFAYDYITEQWTTWSVAALSGVVSTVDVKLLIADGDGYLLQERKAYAAEDYADSEVTFTIASASGRAVVGTCAEAPVAGDRIAQGAMTAVVTAVTGSSPYTLTIDRAASGFIGFEAGSATLYRAYSVSVKWAPKFGDPGASMHARETDLMFRSVYFASATASFDTDLNTTGDSVTLSGERQKLTDPVAGSHRLRVSIPRGEQRCSRLGIGFSMRCASSPMQIQGLEVLYEPGSERSTR